MSMLETTKTAIYIHVPFCPSGCEFCHFFTSSDKKMGYVNLIKKEFALRYAETRFDSVESIFIGGGTPNMLSISEMRELLIFIKEHFLGWKEFSIELHPALLTFEYIDLLHDYGVTRISLGIQTLDPEVLAHHTRVQFGYNKLAQHIEHIQKLGIILNLDFIYNLIGDTLIAIKKNLAFILKHKPDSIFYYQLRPFTEFIRKNYHLDEKERLKQYNYIQKTMQSAGYNQINTATYVKEKFGLETSLEYDKVIYTRNHRLIGFGVAATNHDGNRNYKNTISFETYRDAIENNRLPIDLDFTLSDEDSTLSVLGHILLAYREVDLSKLMHQSGIDISSLRSGVDILIGRGYLSEENGYIRLTQKGLYYQEEILPLLFESQGEIVSLLRAL